MAMKHGLGRGLGALIKDAAASAPAAKAAARGTPPPPTAPPSPPPVSRPPDTTLPIDRIRRSTWQPRRTFEQDSLTELTQSIRENGIIQPLVVRQADGGIYEIIAGERRFRAALEAGLKEVPVIIKNVSNNDAMLLALVENLQREDLNIIEEAEGYNVLSTEHGMTQEQISARVGKARASVANALRILALPQEVRSMLVAGDLSAGHAKALLGLSIPAEQSLYAKRTIQEGLSVRQLEKLVQNAARAPRKPRSSRDDMPPSYVAHLSDRLHSHFGTSVQIEPSRTLANGKKAKGTLQIEFYSNDDLSRILEVMGVKVE